MSNVVQTMIVPVALKVGGMEGVSQIFVWDATQEEVFKWINLAPHRFFMFKVMGEKPGKSIPLVVNLDHIIHVAKEIPAEVIMQPEGAAPALPKPNREMN